MTAADEPMEREQPHPPSNAEKYRTSSLAVQSLCAHSPDAALLFDPADGRVYDFNGRAATMLDLDTPDSNAVSFDDLQDADSGLAQSLVDDVMDSDAGRVVKIDLRSLQGRTVPVEAALSRVDVDGKPLLLCLARDISDREDANQRIQHMAYHDTLTNLPNRTLLTERIERALVRARRTGQAGALLFLDLDRFKRINDSLGHNVGDRLLIELANRLRQALREEDTVARLGGDEFVVLLEGLGQRHDRAVEKAQEITTKLRGVFNEPFSLQGHTLYVTASIGIVTFPNDGDSVDQLLRHADTAMYHAKGNGRDSARVFETRMDEAATSRLRFENELRIGIEQAQFELYFQPVLTIRDGLLLGAEVLLRWRHPDAGLIAPSEFLPYVENCALMLKLDDWVLNSACRLLGRIQQDPGLQAPEFLAINISHQQFHQPDFVERVLAVIEDTGAEPGRLQLEVTEPVLIKDAAETVERMNQLRRIGVRFAIDDFGTGYSSLSDLRRLPLDTIKIDRSFVRDIASDPNDAVIVRAILSMAGHLGLHVIAEGVESREQLQFLREAGCRFYQGYLGRPPLDRQHFVEELRFSGGSYPLDPLSPANSGRDPRRIAGG
ncbi:MAG: EAL domain-containing protein [Gammaproteobacteria bacterium]|nr:EAL domain-containing protein [Gammaproteobacteria bacterium]